MALRLLFGSLALELRRGRNELLTFVPTRMEVEVVRSSILTMTMEVKSTLLRNFCAHPMRWRSDRAGTSSEYMRARDPLQKLPRPNLIRTTWHLQRPMQAHQPCPVLWVMELLAFHSAMRLHVLFQSQIYVDWF